MFVYEKRLEYPIRIKNTNPKLASVIISQYGGPYSNKLRLRIPCSTGMMIQKINAVVNPQWVPTAFYGFFSENSALPRNKLFRYVDLSQVAKRRRCSSVKSSVFTSSSPTWTQDTVLISNCFAITTAPYVNICSGSLMMISDQKLLVQRCVKDGE